MVFNSTSILIVPSCFDLSWLCCFALSFPSENVSFLLRLTLHKSITSIPSIALLFSLLFVQCICAFSNSRIPSTHMFRRSLMTDSNVLRCQKLPDSIIFMICEIMTGLNLCRFDSKGIKSNPSIIMFLYSLTTLCHSIISCMWYCIEGFECTALAYRNIFSSSLIDSASFVVFAEILRCLSASPSSTLSMTRFCYHRP